MPRKEKKSVKEPQWNVGKPDGWKIYEEVTNESADKLADIVEDEQTSINQKMKKMLALETKIKFQAFGKSRERNRFANKKNELENSNDEGVDEDEETRNKELLRKQSEKIEAQVLEIKDKKMGRVGNVFKMKEAIVGSKKSGQVPNAIKDPKTKELVVSSEEIRKVTLQHCVDTLTNNKPAEEVKEATELKKTLHMQRMENN